MVCVCVSEYFNCTIVHFLLGLIRVKMPVAVQELLFLDQAIAVLVPLVEGFLEFGLLGLGGQMAGHEGQSGLLQLGLVLER